MRRHPRNQIHDRHTIRNNKLSKSPLNFICSLDCLRLVPAERIFYLQMMIILWYFPPFRYARSELQTPATRYMACCWVGRWRGAKIYALKAQIEFHSPHKLRSRFEHDSRRDALDFIKFAPRLKDSPTILCFIHFITQWFDSIPAAKTERRLGGSKLMHQYSIFWHQQALHHLRESWRSFHQSRSLLWITLICATETHPLWWLITTRKRTRSGW